MFEVCVCREDCSVCVYAGTGANSSDISLDIMMKLSRIPAPQFLTFGNASVRLIPFYWTVVLAYDERDHIALLVLHECRHAHGQTRVHVTSRFRSVIR
jgi:hypothetical protein